MVVPAAVRLQPIRGPVRAVIDLTDAMGISAVAEGVETEDQLTRLRMLGRPVAQGFYFSQPLCAGEFEDLLTRHFARTTDLQGQY
jgi:EAL domain-containing protein (putative c-di-GMP-specific phosphodiesterase class I)